MNFFTLRWCIIANADVFIQLLKKILSRYIFYIYITPRHILCFILDTSNSQMNLWYSAKKRQKSMRFSLTPNTLLPDPRSTYPWPPTHSSLNWRDFFPSWHQEKIWEQKNIIKVYTFCICFNPLRLPSHCWHALYNGIWLLTTQKRLILQNS